MVILEQSHCKSVKRSGGGTYPEGHSVLVPEVKALVAKVGRRRRGHVLEVVVTGSVIQTGLAVTVAVIVSTSNSFA